MDSEGTREAMLVVLHMMELLERIFGFSIAKTEKLIGVTGHGIGKGIRYVYSQYSSGRMLEGGEKTFRQIVKNRGSLDMAVSTVHIEDWNSREGLEFRKYLDNRNVQYVLLDDVTKGDNKVQFMYHASDAEKINSILRDYKKIKYEDAVPASEAYDALKPEQKAEVNQRFEEKVFQLMSPPNQEMKESVYVRAKLGLEEKKTELAREMQKDTFEEWEEISIPVQYVKTDEARGITFIRCGEKGYVLPISNIQKEHVGTEHGQVDIKIKCRLSKAGQYLEFYDGLPRRISGEKLIQELKHLNHDICRGFAGRKMNHRILEMKGKKR